MFFSIFLILLALVLIGVLSLIVYARWNYGILESLNIPVVKRSFLFGSTPDLHLKVAHFEDIQRFKELGPVYGVYEGRTPQIHICDPELVRQIFVKDFDHFQNRRDVDLGDPVLNEMMDFINDDKWKTVRHALTPSFSAGKVKGMAAITNDIAEAFSQRLKTSCRENNGRIRIEVRDRIAGLVMDFLLRCSLGIQIENSDDPKNHFITLFKELSGNDVTFGWTYMLSQTFPFLANFVPTLNNSATTKFAKIVRAAMASRKETSKSNDFIDRLREMQNLLNTPDYLRLGITDKTIDAQAVSFILAAYDSIVTILTMLFVYLAKYPEIQENLHKEVDDFLAARNGKVNLEDLNQLPYLGGCITETLRLVPPFIRPERICTQDWEYNGLRIKKGIVVMLPTWAYHRNPELFSNPEDFNPTRFMNGNKGNPYGMGSFGFGPRNCVGMKLANETMKVCMIHLLKNFKVGLCPDTRVKYKEAVLFLIQYDPVYLDFIARE